MAVQSVQCKSGEDDKVVDIKIQPTEYNAGNKGCKARYNRHLLLFGSLLVLLLILVVFWTIVVLVKYGSPYSDSFNTQPNAEAFSEATIPAEVTEAEVDTPSTTVANLGAFTLVSRRHWLAQPPVESPNPLSLPVQYVIISHTATENCTDRASCTFHVKFIQTFHIESRNWWDIGYNFLVGGDGAAYEGRGWKSEGAHTPGYNSRSIGIAFIGTFNSVLPPKRQILAAQQLIEKGVSLGYVAPDYKLLAARQLQTTPSPGLTLYEDIKTWPHWVEKP